MKNKEKNFVSAVIYVHNAEERIAEYLGMIVEVLEENFEHSEIICVNDSSIDDSLDIIRSISQLASSTSITIVNMSYFHGLEIAMNAGVDISIGDFVFEFDNTILDFDKEEIINVYHRVLQGYDIVSAIPQHKEKFSSKMFYRIFDKFANFSYQMKTESFRILSRRAINRVASMNKTVPYRKVIYASQGLETSYISYAIKNTVRDKRKPDKQEKGYRLGLAVDSLILFTELGYRFSAAMTAVMMFISAFMVVYSVVVFVTANPVAGWTTTILFLSVAFFGLFGILTIIIKYLQLLVNLVFKRKNYSFAGVEKIQNRRS